MHLIAISPETADPREPATVPALIAAGLARYHVRKPTFTAAQLSTWLAHFPKKIRAHFVLHTHHELADEHACLGLHHRSAAPLSALQPFSPSAFSSRSIHDLATLRRVLGSYTSVFLSPIFPSLSKPGYNPTLAPEEISTFLRARPATGPRTQVIALGGVSLENLPTCRALGFDGAAILGALWQAPDPLAAFAQLQIAAA